MMEEIRTIGGKWNGGNMDCITVPAADLQTQQMFIRSHRILAMAQSLSKMSPRLFLFHTPKSQDRRVGNPKTGLRGDV